MGDAGFNQFMRLRNQLVIEAGNFEREENLTAVQITTLSKVMNEQLKRAHKVVDVADRTNKSYFVTLLRYDVDKTEKLYQRVRSFPKK